MTTVLATTETGPRETAAGAPLVPMRLCYGVNESDSWWHFALGPNRERLWARLRALDVRIIRMFVFDKHAPDPVLDWPSLRAYIQAALNVGATPFITFAKFRRPFDDPRAVRWFTEQCAEIVWSCTEEWGGERVKDWYWCVWNEPNNDWIGGGITFEQYKTVYEQVAEGVARSLRPWLDGRPPLVGGPSVEGFTPFWLDWVWRLLNEVDPSLIGFINWHYYAEWRDVAEAGSPPDEGTMQRLIMAQAPEFGLRAQLVGRLLRGRGLPNICGEWNAHSHYLPAVRGRFNQSLFGVPTPCRRRSTTRSGCAPATCDTATASGSRSAPSTTICAANGMPWRPMEREGGPACSWRVSSIGLGRCESPISRRA